MASGPITSWQIDAETMETVTDFISLGYKIAVDGDCSHEIKRRLLLGRKAMTNLDSMLRSRDITLLTKFCLVKAMVFPVQFNHSVMSNSLWLPNRSTPGFPVHHQHPELIQTHVHWVSDAIQSSCPLLSPSSPAPNPSQHQSLFQWVSSSHQLAKVLEFQLEYQSFQWTPRTDLL